MDRPIYEIKPGMDFILTDAFFMTEQEAGEIGEAINWCFIRYGRDPALGTGLCIVRPVICFKGTAVSVGTVITLPYCCGEWSVYTDGKAIFRGNHWFLKRYDRDEMEKLFKNQIRTMAEWGGIKCEM